MKSTISPRIAILVSALLILAVSCAKDPSNNISYGGSNPTGQPLIGYIVDRGPVSGEVRLMNVVLLNVGSIVDPLSGETVNNSAVINLSFFTTNDGFIQTGMYSFSGDEQKTDFTFDLGTVTEASTSEVKSINVFSITNGSVTVSYREGFYEFSLDCLLDNGLRLVGTFMGEMSYSDDHM